ncbi:nuclear transport factor 2 family protein [Alcanivorax sp. VBW004]|uniref:nuclear transport factor 2 family protein n=1 Tax=Alcanivorax sp. VBW004 TaxID=1287708 RepID=UPI0012BCBAAF|nr:nuclear transport factor 2 family protein [Alcanivorax sp. VBW004]MTT50911.1 nuclear transport factor 2 family protein [Alcanivorax sp. VBW004]
MKIVFCFILILPLSCFSSDVIDREMVEEFLYKEKKFIQNKDVSGFSLLFADDFMGKDRNGKTIGKRDVVTDISSAFINASNLLHSSKIISLSIYKDGSSAELILENETKLLIEVGGFRQVISSSGLTKSVIAIDDGLLKYKENVYLER